MFGQVRSYRQRKLEVDQDQIQSQAEVVRLRAAVARLENVLAQVIASSDDALIGAHSYQDELDLLATQPIEGFAAAWSSSSDSSSQDLVGDDFFATGHVDQRARTWLLATK